MYILSPHPTPVITGVYANVLSEMLKIDTA